MGETEVSNAKHPCLQIELSQILPHWFDRDTHQLYSETETSSVRQWRAIPLWPDGLQR